jgi:H+/Cl- antiporter ClcA
MSRSVIRLKNVGIAILMFILLGVFVFGIDVMRGLHVNEALHNISSSFRVMARGEVIVYIVIFIILLGNVLFSVFQSKKEKKQPSSKESSK